MKKLVFAAAICATCLMAGASTFSWSVDYSYAPGTESYAEGYTAVFFDNADLARDTFIASLSDNSWRDNISTYAGIASGLTDEEGYADGASKRTNYGNPETIQGYLVLFNGDISAADPTLAYVSDLAPGTTGGTAGAGGAVSFGDLTGTQVASNWTAVAPEPTSGLLLLIGMAGLALRRRRA